MKTFTIYEEIPSILKITSKVLANNESDAIDKYTKSPDVYSCESSVEYKWDESTLKITNVEENTSGDKYYDSYKEVLSDLKNRFGKLYYFNDLNRNKSVRRIKIVDIERGTLRQVQNYIENKFPFIENGFTKNQKSIHNGLYLKFRD